VYILLDNNVVFSAFEEYEIIDTRVKTRYQNEIRFYRNDNEIISVGSLPDDFVPHKYIFVNNEFILNPNYKEPEVEIATKTKYSKDEFIDLFTDEQWVNVLTNETTDMNIKLFLMKFNNAPNETIDITKDKVKNGLLYMLQNSYITQEDYDRIYGVS